MSIITVDDIVKVMAQCFIEGNKPAFNIISLETHLEDINILNDKETDPNTLTYINFEPMKSNDFFNTFAELFSALGWEKSFAILNTLRFKFKEKDVINEPITIGGWLEIVRRVVGTVNTSLRYKDTVDG